ncbi:hypothetical protein L3X38_004231 [Prunus dulcis]|uniref:Uncharacterized protein n=1 Tax=Prunus dulcis TaxID=3755 RepID=A0AAD4ZNI9_PRUDU|nr:hypothetical protein L3X38_004231 [Prunus dulcis]
MKKGESINRIFLWDENRSHKLVLPLRVRNNTQRMLKESVPPIFQFIEAFQTTMAVSKHLRSKTTMTTHYGTAETSLSPRGAAATSILQQPPTAANSFQQPPLAAHAIQPPSEAS